MTRFKDEAGSALVLSVMVTTVVLTLITLVVTLSMMMMTQSQAAAKVVSGETLAHTGVGYYELYVERVTASADGVSDVDFAMLTDIESDVIEVSANEAAFTIDDIHLSWQDDDMLFIYYTVNSRVWGHNDRLVEASEDAVIALEFD